MLKLQECEIDANERPLFPSKILKTEVKLIPVKKSVLLLKKSFFVLKYFLNDCRPPDKSVLLKIIFLFINQNICCGNSKEPSQ